MAAHGILTDSSQFRGQAPRSAARPEDAGPTRFAGASGRAIARELRIRLPHVQRLDRVRPESLAARGTLGCHRSHDAGEEGTGRDV
jgi:hypothetical protein